jgi:hypothetical protein
MNEQNGTEGRAVGTVQTRGARHTGYSACPPLQQSSFGIDPPNLKNCAHVSRPQHKASAVQCG